MDYNHLLMAISTMLDLKLDEKLLPIYHRLDNLETRLSNLEVRMEHLETRMDNLETRVGSIEAQMKNFEIRMEKNESDISSIKVIQVEMLNSIKQLDKKVSETYDLALDAWGRSAENRTWLEQSSLQI